MLLSLSAIAQTFQFKFATIEKYLTLNYPPEKVKTAIASSYSIVKQGDTEWKFRDNSKSWEATLYVQFDKVTKKLKEVQFAASQSRVYEFMDELEKNLGYTLLGTEGQMDIYENKTKKLGAKIVSSRIFRDRNGFIPHIQIIADLSNGSNTHEKVLYYYLFRNHSIIYY